MKCFFVCCCIQILLLVSCKNQSSESDKLAYLADTSSITGLTGDSVKLIKTASIHCKVNDVFESTKKVATLARTLGGLISHQNMESYEEQSKELSISNDSVLVVSSIITRSDITARIPSENLDEFLYSVADIATFISSSRMDIEDKSLEYLALQLKQQNRDLLQNGETIKSSVEAKRFALAKKEEAVDQQIRRRAINADVQYSTVQLNLFQNPVIKKEIRANNSIEAYELSFSKRIGNAFSNGWNFFTRFVVLLTHFWMFIVAGLATWMVIRYYQQKKKNIVVKG